MSSTKTGLIEFRNIGRFFKNNSITIVAVLAGFLIPVLFAWKINTFMENMTREEQIKKELNTGKNIPVLATNHADSSAGKNSTTNVINPSPGSNHNIVTFKPDTLNKDSLLISN